MRSESWVPPDQDVLSGYKFTVNMFHTSSPRMLEVIALIRRAALVSWPILIRGESGTGKELVAQALHNLSPCSQGGPFVPVNVARLTESLFESELYGHLKGAFTGAFADQDGLFLRACGGTLFFDELGDLLYGKQPSLFRVYTEGKYQPVGGELQPVECRIVMATDRDIEAMCGKEGGFRPELFYRVNRLPIMLPPLRERREDILPSFLGFYERACADFAVEVEEPPEDLRALLEGYTWPGNFRDLETFATACAAKGTRPAMEELRRKISAEAEPVPHAQLAGEGKTFTERKVKHVVELYYENHKDVGLVAKALGRCRTTVFKFLAIARKRGWLRGDGA